MPGKAKKPTNQSITIITIIVNNVFIIICPVLIWSLAMLNLRDCEPTPTF
jgi:hypothetical protein